MLGLLFVSVIFGLGNVTRNLFHDSIFIKNGDGDWTESSVKVAGDSDSRLDIRLSKLSSASSPDAADQRYIPTRYYFSVNEVAEVKSVEISVKSSATDNRFHTHFNSLKVQPDGSDFWLADNDEAPAHLPMVVKREFFYPFEFVEVLWEKTFNDLPELDEITVYNGTGQFRIVNFEANEEKLSVAGDMINFNMKLIRSSGEKILFFVVMILGVMHLLLVVFVLKNKYLFLFSWLAVLLLYLGYRIFLIPELYSSFIFSDVVFAALTYVPTVLSLYLIPSIASPSYKVFVSYRYGDNEYAVVQVVRYLDSFMSSRLLNSSKVFYDKDEVDAGGSISSTIREAIKECEVVIVIIGRQWLSMTDDEGQRKIDNDQDYTRLELEAAFEMDKHVIPVLIESATVPSREELPQLLRRLSDNSGIKVRPDERNFMSDMRAVLAGLKRLDS